MTRFLSENASAMFALAGALGAGAIAAFTALRVKRREFDLAMASKLFDRRIAAHEKVIALATEMRLMVGLPGTDEKGEALRAPSLMISREIFEDWLDRFAQQSLGATSWLSTEAKRELNLVQDYMLTLHMHLAAVPSEEYPALGALIRQDFIDLSSSLEKKAFQFFREDIRELRLHNLDEWHKYERKETERRLGGTVLVTSFQQFAEKRSAGAR